MDLLILNANALYIPLADQSVQCCVTSPPYYGLRDYGIDGQLGLEKTPEEYVEKMVQVFREVWRVMKDDGTLWLNLGDSYAGSGKGIYADGLSHDTEGIIQKSNKGSIGVRSKKSFSGLKAKDLIGIPWMVAFALRKDGWYLRSDCIWSKPNPMPESVTDRPTKSHEYLFLLSKSQKYFYDIEAIKEPVKDSSLARLNQDIEHQEGSERGNGGMKSNGKMKAVKFGGNKAVEYGNTTYSGKEWNPQQGGGKNGFKGHSGNMKADGTIYLKANKKSVWEIPTQSFEGAHFATYPEKLVEPCILAGSRAGDWVLDPFAGSGTTGRVAIRHNRKFVGLELNPNYIEIAKDRTNEVQRRLL